MIIFHEGLPRSGKSWEAIHEMAVPALKAGRHVVTNIKGTDAAKIAECYQLDPDAVAAQLTVIDWDKSSDIHEHAKNDGLVIFDEVQDFHPQGKKLNPAQIEFITQHGQRGIDVVLCGQAMGNIHVFWRDRVQRLVYFQKMSSIGADSRYQWTMQERVGPKKFSKVSSGIRKYDKAKFGCYKSHADGVENKANLKDDRANILKKPGIRFGLPVAFLVLCFAVNYVWGLFHKPAGEALGINTKAVQTASAPASTTAGAAAAAQDKAKDVGKGSAVGTLQSALEATSVDPVDYLEGMMNKYRPRLAAFMKMGRKEQGLIELMDDSYKVREQIKLTELQAYGYGYEYRGDFILIKRLDGKGKPHTVTPWPVDPWGRANNPPVQQNQQTQIAQQQGHPDAGQRLAINDMDDADPKANRFDALRPHSKAVQPAKKQT
ncbi:zonular occludens toxin domain-containing protein [Aquitalea aquatilis]|uniref:zonular occludens toxin domain-containing protein n=1 Tax=Aquitalea aquatilis TaxID=1537400 RepID=UPI0010BD0CE5|nr:zonular occludens toxin domain-containing protein [Aquitalea aquatilis]